MPAPTFLFALAPQAGDALHNRRAPAMSAGAHLLLRCARGETAPQKKCGEDDVCQSLFALCLLVSVVIKFFLFLKLNNI